MTDTSNHDLAQGRRAPSPWRIPWSGWRAILKRTYREMDQDHVGVIAAGVAFYGLLALFPAVAALLSIAGLIFDPQEVVRQMTVWASGLPQGAAAIITDQAVSVAAGSGTALSLAALGSLAVALFSAAKGTKTLMEGMNVAYEEEETRGLVRLNLVALGLTGLLILAVLVAAALGAVVPIVIDLLQVPPVLAFAVDVLRWLALAALAIAGLSLLYRYGPAREDPKWRWITPGAVAAIVLWLAGTAAFSVYVGRFGSYNETYGALGGVVVLLTWLWLSSFIILLGAELNAEIEHETTADTTTGEDKPMGERGAAMADTVAAHD